MQAVLLAAGKSSRFFPFNRQHKSLVKVLGKPIIAHTIESIKKAGIGNIIIVSDPQNPIKDILGNGKLLGVKIDYVILEKPTGMGDALLKARQKITSNFFLVHPHHVDFYELTRDVKLDEAGGNALLFIKKEKSVSNFGVVTLKDEKVLSITEKPNDGEITSNLKVIGIYYLTKDFIDVLSKTKTEHYSFEKALDKYASMNKVKAKVIKKDTISLKYPWDLLKLKTFLLSNSQNFISKKAKISKNSKITGNVIIEDGVIISENAVIKGPCYLGKDVFVGTNSLIRDGVSLEQGVRVGAFVEIKNSLVLENTTFHSGFIGDSVIGPNCKIGTSFNTTNVRLDRTNVSSFVGDKKTDTGLGSLGIIMGGSVVVGGNVSAMPGVIVGENVNIGPSTTVMKNIPSNTVYYTKFQEIVEKSKD